MLTQSAPPRADAKVKPALLFVDDERRVLTSMRAMFRREYEVLLANSGHEAIEILEERDDIHVVVSDQRMPEMTGVELLATVKTDYPSSMRILLTGYADLDAVEASINESEVFRYLMKPCPTDELKGAVRLAVQAARVSEMAGVVELAAVPEDELEKIELTGVVEEPEEVLELEAVGAESLEGAEGIEGAEGFDVTYADPDSPEVRAYADEFAAASGDVVESDAVDESVNESGVDTIEPASFSASDVVVETGVEETGVIETGVEETRAEETAVEDACDSEQTSDAQVRSDSDGVLDEALQSTLADADQDADQDTNPSAQALPAAPVDPEVLVLSQDAELLEGVSLAIGPQYAVRDADSIDSALRQLSEYPIGVLITDLAVDEREIDELTRTLKHEVPELVTIIASERSDAALLIGLINHGQIFRFLLKPLQVAQTRIWLNSAMTKYAELCANSNTVLRHQVARNAEIEAANTGLFANVRARIKTIKERFASSLITGLKGSRDE